MSNSDLGRSQVFRPILLLAAAAVIGVAGYRFLNPVADQRGISPPVAAAERVAVEAIELSGSASFKLNDDGHVIQLTAVGADVTDAVVTNVTQLPHLQVLSLNESSITDEALGDIGTLSELRTLLLEKTAITGHGLQSLASLKTLQHLSLAGCSVGEAGTTAISAMTTLEILDLRRSDITDDGLRSLAKLNSLQRLYLNETKISGEGLDAFEAHPNIQLLNLDGIALNENGVSNLSRFPNLVQLYLNDIALNEELLATVVDTVVTSLPRLEALFLARTGLSDSSIETLKRLGEAPELFTVSLSGTKITRDAYRILAKETPNISYMVDYN